MIQSNKTVILVIYLIVLVLLVYYTKNNRTVNFRLSDVQVIDGLISYTSCKTFELQVENLKNGCHYKQKMKLNLSQVVT